MAVPILYPPADATSEWYGRDYPGVDMGGVDKVLLHSTEGGGWPPYKHGSEAPNLTYHPRLRQWRQHLPLNRSARALVDATDTTIRENRARVVQVEIVAVCDPSVSSRSSKLLAIGDLTDESLADLGAFLAFMHTHYGVPLIAAPKWLPYPRSAGNSAVRMSGRQYGIWRGVLGHQHASGNVHGDPGSLNVPRVMWHANRLSRPTTPLVVPPVPTPVMPTTPSMPTTTTTTSPVPAQREDDDMAYKLARTPDNRYWGLSGLQCTHLETAEVRNAFMALTGLALTDAVPVSYDLLENFQRIT